jgi:hypothetical protein
MTVAGIYNKSQMFWMKRVSTKGQIRYSGQLLANKNGILEKTPFIIKTLTIIEHKKKYLHLRCKLAVIDKIH